MIDSPAIIPYNSSGNELGTITNPIKTDPTGTTTQPITGIGTAGTPDTKVITVQGIATGTAIPVSSNSTNMTATVVQSTATNLNATVSQATGANLHTTVDSGTITANIGTVGTLATAANQTTGNTSLNNIDTKTPPLGQATMTNSMPITIASNQSALSVKEVIASTATLTNVCSSTSDTSLLAANSNRLGVIIYNDSTATLYLKFGTGASSTSFTYYIATKTTWEMETQRYTGAINGCWSSTNGTARITELIP